MKENFSFHKENKAVAVALKLPDMTYTQAQASLDELKFLAKTLKIEVVESMIQTRTRANASYLIGQGKLDEIKEYISHNQIDAVIFDNELSGIQERNIEKYLDVAIFGRTEIILNIFNTRAKTTEAKLQVQLAFMEYMKPRLRHLWDHFSRVEGGIGMRGGEGEKQLELDRRMLQDQIDRIKKRLKKVDTQMKNRRKKRLDKNIVSLVGYTNAGKSTLFNRLARSDQFTEDKLFATLDSTTRKVYINDDLTILLNDTVGFINKLPHSLVASFKSTLDEILSSRLILHVIDASSQDITTHIESVRKVLDEIGVSHIPIIRVFNKSDLLENGKEDCLVQIQKGDIFISALNDDGLEDLKETVFKELMRDN